MSVTNTKLLIILGGVVVVVVVLVAFEAEDTVAGVVAVEGSLIINGGLVPPSYTLVLKPDNGATERYEPHAP
jgi:hypothetical protein